MHLQAACGGPPETYQACKSKDPHLAYSCKIKKLYFKTVLVYLITESAKAGLLRQRVTWSSRSLMLTVNSGARHHTKIQLQHITYQRTHTEANGRVKHERWLPNPQVLPISWGWDQMPAVTCEFNARYDFCKQTGRENITHTPLFSFNSLKEYALSLFKITTTKQVCRSSDGDLDP